MKFKQFMIEQSSLRKILEPIPQNPRYHKEGNVFKHTQLVRHNLEVAVELLDDASKMSDSAFSNLDLNLSLQDLNFLRLGGWLHDIGKASATALNDKGEIAAHDHEKEQHFEPMMQQLGPIWQKMYEKTSSEEKAILWFMIRNHMSLRNGIWSKRLHPELLDNNGKYKDERKVKLLLILVLMDQMGRYGTAEPTFGLANAIQTLNNMQATADLVKKSVRKPRPEFNSKQDFVDYLRAKGISDDEIARHTINKYGQD